MKHGFARTSYWRADPIYEKDGECVGTFHLTDSETTRSIWNHRFELIYTVYLSATQLTTELKLD